MVLSEGSYMQGTETVTWQYCDRTETVPWQYPLVWPLVWPPTVAPFSGPLQWPLTVAPCHSMAWAPKVRRPNYCIWKWKNTPSIITVSSIVPFQAVYLFLAFYVRCYIHIRWSCFENSQSEPTTVAISDAKLIENEAYYAYSTFAK